MKKITVSLAIVCLSLGSVLNGASSSDGSFDHSADAKYQLPKYIVHGFQPPVPSKMVAPKVSRVTEGKEAIIEFRISATGRAYDLEPGAFAPNSNPRDLESVMRSALRYWEFEPARDAQGNPVSVKVALPVKLIRDTEESSATVKLAIAEPTVLVASSR